MEWCKSKTFTFSVPGWSDLLARFNVRNASGMKRSSEPLTEFTCFQNLPLELREMIWTFASHRARVISLDSGRNYRILNNKPPAVLQINAESRKIALKYYSLLSLQDRKPETYLNFKVDIIHVDPSYDHMVPCDEFGVNWVDTWSNDWWNPKIERLAVSTSTFSIYKAMQDILDGMGTYGVTLKELILVDDCRASNGCVERNLIPLKRIDVIACYEMGVRNEGDVNKIGEYLEYSKGVVQKAKKNMFKKELENLGWTKDEIKKIMHSKKPKKTEADWAKKFSPLISVMQLRNNYHNGVEGTTPKLILKKQRSSSRSDSDSDSGSASDEEEEVKPEPKKPIYLGDLRKVDGVWDIVRR